MDIRKLPIHELHPAPYNPRKALKPGMPGYRRLERSLREFDLVQPLVWNRTTGHLVSGHQRLEILKAKGVTEVEVVVVELPLKKEQALNIALNNSLVGGDWEPEKLIDIVRELQAAGDVDAALTGFDADELRDLLLAPNEERTLESGDEAEADVVRVQFEAPVDGWETIRGDFDEFVATHGLRAHVRMPGAISADATSPTKRKRASRPR